MGTNLGLLRSDGCPNMLYSCNRSLASNLLVSIHPVEEAAQIGSNVVSYNCFFYVGKFVIWHFALETVYFKTAL